MDEHSVTRAPTKVTTYWTVGSVWYGRQGPLRSCCSSLLMGATAGQASSRQGWGLGRLRQAPTDSPTGMKLPLSTFRSSTHGVSCPLTVAPHSTNSARVRQVASMGRDMAAVNTEEGKDRGRRIQRQAEEKSRKEDDHSEANQHSRKVALSGGMISRTCWDSSVGKVETKRRRRMWRTVRESEDECEI